MNVTEHADELLDNLVYHLIYRLKNKEAAKHLLDNVECIYDRLMEKLSYNICSDNGYSKCGWHFSSIRELPRQIIINF